MEPHTTLIEAQDATQPLTSSCSSVCPRCGEPWGALPPIVTNRLAYPLRRCLRCGCRTALAPSGALPVPRCESCRRPFLPGVGGEPPEATRCADCFAEGQQARTPLEAALAVASSAEARAAVGTAWPFVSIPALTAYAEGLARDLAQRLGPEPPPIHVHFVREPAFRSIFLAPGDLVLSTGLLGDLIDEAELIFVLGHELVHGLRHDAGAELSRVALRALARRPEHHGAELWVQSVLEIVRLGYGRAREIEADLGAVMAMRDSGYDVAAALRLLARLDQASRRGAPEVAEWVLSHPTAAERQRQIEVGLREAGDGIGVAPRVNREPFRRAVAELKAGGALPSARPFVGNSGAPSALPAASVLRWLAPLVVVAAGLLAAAAWWVLR